MTENFRLEGFYDYVQAPNGRGDLTGKIEISEDGSFSGEIYDHASRNPEQKLKGYFNKKEGVENLCFLKIPDNSNLANIVYSLTNEKSNSREGKYSGNWMAAPFKIEYNEEFNLFMASFDMSVCRIGNSAEINLYKE